MGQIRAYALNGRDLIRFDYSESVLYGNLEYLFSWVIDYRIQDPRILFTKKKADGYICKMWVSKRLDRIVKFSLFFSFFIRSGSNFRQ